MPISILPKATDIGSIGGTATDQRWNTIELSNGMYTGSGIGVFYSGGVWKYSNDGGTPHNLINGNDVTAYRLDQFATPADNTTNDATVTYHGLLPKLSGLSNQYLSGAGTWVTVSGGGDMFVATYDTNSDGRVNAADTSTDADNLGGVPAGSYLRKDATVTITTAQRWADNISAYFGTDLDTYVRYNTSTGMEIRSQSLAGNGNITIDADKNSGVIRICAKNAGGITLEGAVFDPDGENLKTDFNTIRSRAGVAVANTGIIDTNIPYDRPGTLYIRVPGHGTNGNGVIYTFGCNLALTDGLTRQAGDGAKYTVTQGNAGTINVYRNVGTNTLYIENQTGGIKTIYWSCDRLAL